MENLSFVDVSFCLPVYNVKPFMSDCISSILNQPFGDITYEVLMVDDCSKDGSFEMARELADENPKIRVMKNEQNMGVSYTRNKMVIEAKGTYIWFIDPDDMLINGAIHYVREAKRLDADVLLGNYIRVPENESGNGRFLDIDFEKDEFSIRENFKPIDPDGRTMSACWAGVFKKEFLISNDLKFNEKMIAQEDTLFYYQFPMRTSKIYKSDSSCYLYRYRKGSVMRSHNDERSKKYYLSMVEMLRVYEEHLEKGDYPDEAILKDKILHSRQNVTTCLASVSDNAFVKEHYKLIKKEGIYPYPFRLKTLKGGGGKVLKLFKFLLPIRGMFPIYRFVYRIYKK